MALANVVNVAAKPIASVIANHVGEKLISKLSVDLEKGRNVVPHATKHGKVTLHPVKSSNIHSLGYDPDRRELHVKFLSGHEGHYSNADHNTFIVIMAAPSKGKALHRLVQAHPDRYPWIPHAKE
jgi:hypothetical protein